MGVFRWFQQQEALETLHREATIAIRDNEEEVVWELLTDADKVRDAAADGDQLPKLSETPGCCFQKVPALVFQLLVLERWHSNQIPKFVEEVDLSSEAGLKLRFIVGYRSRRFCCGAALTRANNPPDSIRGYVGRPNITRCLPQGRRF